jgi:hypothetical protein
MPANEHTAQSRHEHQCTVIRHALRCRNNNNTSLQTPTQDTTDERPQALTHPRAPNTSKALSCDLPPRLENNVAPGERAVMRSGTTGPQNVVSKVVRPTARGVPDTTDLDRDGLRQGRQQRGISVGKCRVSQMILMPDSWQDRSDMQE